MRNLAITVLLCFCVILPERFDANAWTPGRQQLSSSRDIGAKSACVSKGDIINAVQRLSIGSAESNHAEEQLIKNSRTSPKCRMEVIESLVDGMSKNLQIGRDSDSYYLWVLGAEVLAKLRATEALGFLISHLTLYDGRSPFGEAHRPAAGAVIRIGPPAVPKLYSLLRESPDRKIRMHAIYCLGLIGGRSALRALQNALPAESDPCVSRFLRLSIAAFHNPTIPNRITSRDRLKWLGAFMCND